MEKCIKPSCPISKRLIILKSGQCQKCEDYHILKDQYTCLNTPTCNWNYKITKDGKCEKCPNYQTAVLDKDQHECRTRYCNENEYINMTGECVRCKPFMVSKKFDKHGEKSCEQVTCAKNLKVSKSGMCLNDTKYFIELLNELPEFSKYGLGQQSTKNI